jgi:hypothetical protein
MTKKTKTDKKEAGGTEGVQHCVMPDIVKRPIYGFGNGCRKCIFSDPDSSLCTRPDELDCYDDKTEQDYYFAKKA